MSSDARAKGMVNAAAERSVIGSMAISCTPWAELRRHMSTVLCCGRGVVQWWRAADVQMATVLFGGARLGAGTGRCRWMVRGLRCGVKGSPLTRRVTPLSCHVLGDAGGSPPSRS